jgi:4-hydroxy-tetrahydrodipicolinate synthase
VLRGTFTALVTPFRGDGSLDEEALVRLVELQLEAGVDGLVFFGTTGEEAALTLDERRRIIELVQKSAEGHLFVVAGAFHNVTEHAISLAREMDWLGVDAILSVVPYDTRPNQEGIIEHFRRIADAVDSPVILSNAPGRVATALEAESVAILAEHDNIRGLDESSGDLDFLSSVIAVTDEEFGIFSSEDTLTLPMIALGADGAFSLVSNEAPARMAKLVEASLEGNFTEARELHYELFELMRVNYIETNPIPVKAALAMMGLIEERFRLPLVPPDDANRDAVKRILLGLDLLPAGSDEI